MKEPSPNAQILLVFGGTGYVGCKVLEVAASRGIACRSVSRSGQIPAHLRGSSASWLTSVEWIKGDASCPEPGLFQGVSAVIGLVGSPPVPTFSQTAFEQQLLMNGTTQAAVVEAAKSSSANRVVVLGAHIPKLLRSKKFAYYLGKEMALQAAMEFAALSPKHSAAVLRPSAIYGTRHTRSGTPIPLGFIMAPIAWLMSRMPQFITRHLPASPVAVEKVATAIVELALDDEAMSSNTNCSGAASVTAHAVGTQAGGESAGGNPRFTLIENSQLLNWC